MKILIVGTLVAALVSFAVLANNGVANTDAYQTAAIAQLQQQTNELQQKSQGPSPVNTFSSSGGNPSYGGNSPYVGNYPYAANYPYAGLYPYAGNFYPGPPIPQTTPTITETTVIPAAGADTIYSSKDINRSSYSQLEP